MAADNVATTWICSPHGSVVVQEREPTGDCPEADRAYCVWERVPEPPAAYRSEYHERDYIERTIETVRNHQHADNCWPQWANIFADEIERLWAENERLHKRQLRLMELVSHGDE